MSVTKVWERWEGRGGTADEKAVRTLTREWGVTTDSDATGEPAVVEAVIAYDLTAALFFPHPNWPRAICRKITAKPWQSARQWLVNAEYSSAPFAGLGDGTGGSGEGGAPSPADQSQDKPADQRPPKITVSRKEVTKLLEFDLVEPDPADPENEDKKKRITNTLGYPFDPPPEVFRSHHVITWKFFRTPAQLNWPDRSEFHDTINADEITVLGRTYKVGTLRCIDYSVDTEWETSEAGLALFFSLTVQAEYDKDGWQPKPLNTGRLGRKSSLSDPVLVFTDGAGQPLSDPVPITENGIKVEPGHPADFYHLDNITGYLPKNWLGTGGSLTGAGGLLF